jgi:putative Mg2+ transporter-C (MgtC) family protein
MDLFAISPLRWESLLCCFLAAFIIGLERQLQGKPVGIRTSSLICMGTYIFIAMSRETFNPSTDPSRIVGQVVTGIGFLGAGVMLAKDGIVVGVTSAAAIWILAAIGVVVALDHPWLGVKVAVLTVVILVGVNLMESTFGFMQRGVHHRLSKRQNGHGPDASSPLEQSSE